MESEIFTMGINEAELLMAVFTVLLGALALALVYWVVAYVLQSISLHTVARRRGIKRPWLAWVPFGGDWILGSISDQFRYVRCGEIRSRRWLLLVLNGLVSIIAIAELATNFSIVWELTEGDLFATAASEALVLEMIELMESTFWYNPAISLMTTAVEVAALICFYRCLWDYYGSCRPKTRLVFLLLSIFVGVPMPFFMFICRKDDLGMPPKRVVEEAALPPVPAALPACGETTE